MNRIAAVVAVLLLTLVGTSTAWATEGACCIVHTSYGDEPTNACLPKTSADCEAADGVYLGDGVDCTDSCRKITICPPAAAVAITLTFIRRSLIPIMVTFFTPMPGPTGLICAASTQGVRRSRSQAKLTQMEYHSQSSRRTLPSLMSTVMKPVCSIYIMVRTTRL